MTLWRRIFGACFALWFTFVVTEPIPFHECAMHNPLALMPRVAGHALGGTPAVGMECGHIPVTAHHDASSHGGHSSHGKRTSHHCACLGCCAGTSLATILPPSNTIPVPVRLVPHRVAYAVGVSTVTAPAFTLPLSTAPPRQS